MSMLAAPRPGRYAFPVTEHAGVAGLLTLNELQPMTGEFRAPPGWPPQGAMDGLGRWGRGRGHGRGGRWQGLTKEQQQSLLALKRSLQAQGLPRAEIRERLRRAHASLVQASAASGAPAAPRRRPAPAVRSLADEPQSFTSGDSLSGLGQAGAQAGYTPQQIAALNAQRQALWHAQRSAYGDQSAAAAAKLYALQQQAAGLARKYVAPPTRSAPGAAPASHEGGARMYVDPTAQLQTSYIEGKVNLEPICDESGKCIGYVEPEYVEKMIGQKVGGQSALVTGKAGLPGFYQHPTLGPWGVDPNQAYQYWAAQQAAMQAGAYATPMQSAISSIWGSPGMQASAPALPVAPGASASFAQVPGQATERF